MENPFCQRLRDARKSAGISQKNLGILVGIDESVASSRMNHYEIGRHAPDFQLVEAMARVLKVPTAYFYAQEDWLADVILKEWQAHNRGQDLLDP